MSDQNRMSWLESFSFRSFQFIGFLLATYFASIQVADYWKNESASLISFTKYHTTKNGKYPTFSICYTPGDPSYYEYLYQDEKIKEYLGLNTSIYNSMIMGQQPLNRMKNFTLLEFDEAKWDLMIYMLRYYGAYEHMDKTVKYWDSEGSNISEIPFYVAYQDFTQLCITRREFYEIDGIVSYEDVFLDTENWEGELSLYIHYPGQLTTKAATRKAKHDPSKVIYIELSSNRSLELNGYNLAIRQVQVLRRRQTSKFSCNADVDSNVDMRWREAAMQKVGCIPTYWKNLEQSKFFQEKGMLDCKARGDYNNLSNIIVDAAHDFESSCTWPSLSSIILQKGRRQSDSTIVKMDDNYNLIHSSLMISITYESDHYMEIWHVQEICFEDVWSQIGGIIGIFLGYSLTNIPGFFFDGASGIKNIFRRIFR